MIDDNDIHRLDEIYVRKDDCQEIQSAKVVVQTPKDGVIKKLKA